MGRPEPPHEDLGEFPDEPEGVAERGIVWKGTTHKDFTTQWTLDDRAWVAGFLDGEGWIGILKVASKTCRDGYYYVPSVVVRQVDRRPLDRLFSLLGEMASLQPHKASNIRWADQWSINVRNRGVLQELLFAVLPALSIKREQAVTVLAFLAGATRTCITRDQASRTWCYNRCRSLSAEAPRAYHLPTGPHDDAWLGAVIEGEGSIGIAKHGKSGNGHVYTLRVSVGMTDEGFVRRIQAVARCGTVHVERRSHRGIRDCWWWVTGAKRGRAILERIFPFLDRKKAHVEVARRFYATAMTFNMKSGVPPEVLAAKISCYEEMKALNRRGPRLNSTASLELRRRAGERTGEAPSA